MPTAADAIGDHAQANAAAVATRPRRRWRRALFVLALAVASIPVFGCTSTITPPASPATPTTVFLLSEAMHTGIVLPPLGPDDEFVEFGYGDWSWFALGNDAWYRVFPTVLWPTQGALGRRTFGARDERQLRAAAWWTTLSPLVVDAAKVRTLRTKLQARFDAGASNAVRRQDLGFDFVPSDDSYWFGFTCADAAAAWFRELDCEIGWTPIRGGLDVTVR